MDGAAWEGSMLLVVGVVSTFGAGGVTAAVVVRTGAGVGATRGLSAVLVAEGPKIKAWAINETRHKSITNQIVLIIRSTFPRFLL